MMTKHIAILFLLLFATSCEDEQFSAVPDIKFPPIYIYLDDPEFFSFDIGTSIALDEKYGGYAGLILYYFSETDIRAFDRCCPIHVDDKEQLEVDGALAFCPTDSAYFSLLDTPPIEYGSSTPAIMRTYNTYLSGTTLRISN